jgi:hypothetical protein
MLILWSYEMAMNTCRSVNAGSENTGLAMDCSVRYSIMDQRISTTTAQLDDASAMARFLAPIPNADTLAILIQPGESLSTRAYDDESDTARFIESDGRIVMCITVRDITIDQAEMIEIQYENGRSLGEAPFLEAVQRVLGPNF